MSTLHRTTLAPKRFAARLDLDSREIEEPLGEILIWIKETLSGQVYWRSTQFRDPKQRTGRYVFPSRQRHFKDGYFVYTFWITNPKDVMIFTLRFSRLG